MANGWTLERRKRQSELIRQWRPWEQATGPRSEEGKARSALRGYKGGQRAMLRELGRALRAQDRNRRTLLDP
jgi:hypothetical protein